MAQPQVTPQDISKMAQMYEKMQNAPKAGKISKSTAVNDQIQTFRILNRDDASTISESQFPKIENMNQGLFVLSDADHELLFLIEFKQEIDLDSITFYAIQPPKEEEHSAPKTIAIYKVDSLNKDFDDVNGTKPDAQFVAKKEKLKTGQKFSFKKKAKARVKFSKVSKLLIYISGNVDDTEQTYLNGMQFTGVVKETTDMDKWEEVAAEAKKKLNE
eukprot:535101_1